MTRHGSARRLALLASLLAGMLHLRPLQAQELVSFPTEDGGLLFADAYGKGDRGVVLAHGGRFDKASWREQARALEAAGFRVLAFDFRGYGRSRGPGDADPLDAPLHLDVLAAVRFLRNAGASAVFAVGASMGGDAAAEASIRAGPGGIERLVLLAAGAYAAGKKIPGRKLFLVARDDVGPGNVPRLSKIRPQYEAAPPPKELVVVPGSAHAQFLFGTGEGDRVMREILRFLTAP